MNESHRDPTPRVLKIGGSCLSAADAAPRLRRLVERRHDAGPVAVVVGGGGAVDWLRRVDRQNGADTEADTEAAHWAAVAMMDANAELVAGWLGWPPPIGGLATLREKLASGEGVVFRCLDFLRGEEPSLPGSPLPRDWSVTSDSIAARVAAAIGGELILVKSVPPPDGVSCDDWGTLAEQGYVDRAFPSVAAGVASVSVAVF